MRLLDVLLPPACAGCGAPGALLCHVCRRSLHPPSDSRDRFLAPDAGVVIGDALGAAMAGFGYDGPMRRALAALKYAGASRLAPILAQLALPALDRLLAIAGPAALVPVPVHRERLADRGYNQAALIARALSNSSGVRWVTVLERVRPTTRQHWLDRAARLANLRGAFQLTPGAAVPKTVILIDDIITTTATLEACASVLCDGGAEAVYGFALAREV